MLSPLPSPVLPMTASDASWLRMDRSENTADIVALLWLDGPLDPERVRRVVEERLLPIERFRRRAIAGAVGRSRWELDVELSSGHHVRRVRVDRGGLRAFVGDVASSGLDPAHPPWQLFVVEEDGGASALVAKLHHVLGDGFALVAVLQALIDEAAGAPPTPAPAAEHRSLLRALAGPTEEALNVGATLARLAALRSDPEDTAAPILSGVRRVAWSSPLPRDALRRVAHGHGASTNDLLLAAVAGGLRSVLGAAGKITDRPRRAIVPVNLRRGAPDVAVDAALGNQFGLVFLELPVHLPTARERLAHLRGRLRTLRSAEEAAAVRDVLAIAGWLPTPLHHLLTGYFAGKASLVVTNVPGVPFPVHVAGRTVTGAVFWVPHPANLGLGVSLLGYAGAVRIGVRADRALLQEPAELVARIEEELAELGAEVPAGAGERGSVAH